MSPTLACYFGEVGKHAYTDRESLAESIRCGRLEIQVIRFIHGDLHHFAQNQDFNGRLDTTITESRTLTHRYVIAQN
jgi:hypothetical protein